MWPALPALTSLTGGGGLTGGASGPAESRLTGGASAFDASGWTVSTGSSKATGGLELSPLLIAGAALVALLVLWRLTKKS